MDLEISPAMGCGHLWPYSLVGADMGMKFLGGSLHPLRRIDISTLDMAEICMDIIKNCETNFFL